MKISYNKYFFILIIFLGMFPSLFSQEIIFEKKAKMLLQSGGKIKALTVSPNGKYLALSSTIRDKKGDIYLYNIITKKKRLLTINNAFDSQPVFSSDNTTLYFFSRRKKMGGIYKISINNNKRPTLITPEKYWCEHPSVSNDGKFLAYISERKNQYTMYELNLITKKEKILINNTSVNLRPIYSSDSNYIFFASNTTGSFNIFQYNRKTKELKKEKWPGGFTFQPTKDDSRKFLVAVSNRNKNKDLFLIPLIKQLKIQQITFSNSHDFFPALDTKNKILYFVSNRNGNMAIYSIKYKIKENGKLR